MAVAACNRGVLFMSMEEGMKRFGSHHIGSVQPCSHSDKFLASQVHVKREHFVDTGDTNNLPVPPNKRHRPSYSALESGESASFSTSNHGAPVIKNSPGSASSDQQYLPVPNYDDSFRSPSLVTGQSQYIGHSRLSSFPNPNQHRQSHSQFQSQVYGTGSHRVASHVVSSLDHPAKQFFPSDIASNNVQSHDVTDGLQIVGSKPFPDHRHQHEALGTETGSTASQRLPQYGQPIQEVYQHGGTTFSLYPTLEDHGGLGQYSEHNFSHGSIASGHGSETTSNSLEGFSSGPYSQGTGGDISAGYLHIPGGPPSYLLNPQPYSQSISYSSGVFANQNFALQPSQTVSNPGSIDLQANPGSFNQSHYFHSTNPPHRVPLNMGGGESYPREGGLTSPEETAALLSIPHRQRYDLSLGRDSLSVQFQSNYGTPDTSASSYRLGSNVPSVETHLNEQDGRNSVRSGTSSDPRVKRDSTSQEITVGDIELGGAEPVGQSSDESQTGPKKRRSNHNNKSGEPKVRGTLSDVGRAEARETRSLGACLPCHFQKSKCEIVDGDRDGPCRRCRNIIKDSKKVIHGSIDCTRVKLHELVLYRSGGLGLTQRWQGVAMKDIGAADRVPNSTRDIAVTQGLYTVHFLFRVVKFIPQDGDELHRYWTDIVKGKEVQKKKELEPYCFENINTVAIWVEKYTIDHAMKVMYEQVLSDSPEIPGRPRKPMSLTNKTYWMALRYYHDLRTTRPGVSESKEMSKERMLLGNLFVFWLAIRHTTGSFWIAGEDTLDMEPETKDQSYPLFGRVSVSRMIVAQFDSVNHKILEKYKSKVLTGFDELISRSSVKPWLTLYIVMFILCREVSTICGDRYRHARDNYGSKLRYSIPGFVEDLQVGCNKLLMHWHYYNWRAWPEAKDYDTLFKTHLRYLTAEQRYLVMETMYDPDIRKHLGYWKQEKEENGYVESIRTVSPDEKASYTGSQVKFDWDHELYWIAQLFEDGWKPHRTYIAEPVPRK